MGMDPLLSNKSISLGLIPDYAEENWPSMALCAEMLHKHLKAIPSIQVTNLCPPFRKRFLNVPIVQRKGAAFNADRLLNRFWDYPKHLRSLSNRFDFYHLCDHSYSQLVHDLPQERTGVYCHDLDTFRCILEPKKDPRPGWFRRMMRKTIDGFRKARIVFHTTQIIRKEILRFDLIPEDRLVHAPNGVSEEFNPSRTDLDREPLPDWREKRFLLHVGSCIPRKRIDLLLQIFREVHRQHPNLLLVQIGGEWTSEQRQLIDQLGIENALFQKRGISREMIAALYRRAELVLLPSEAEGFGLPLIEGLACGSVVVASDIPVLREVGGSAAIYCAVGDIDHWSNIILSLLNNLQSAPSIVIRLEQAKLYTWEQQAKTIAETYQRILAS
jgi:glycosyltransferase involved in cell wall biosynthesis